MIAGATYILPIKINAKIEDIGKVLITIKNKRTGASRQKIHPNDAQTVLLDDGSIGAKLSQGDTIDLCGIVCIEAQINLRGGGVIKTETAEAEIKQTLYTEIVLGAEAKTVMMESVSLDLGAPYTVGGGGENGATFYPNIDADGNLSWTNDKGLENPPPVNIKGKDYVLKESDKEEIRDMVFVDIGDVVPAEVYVGAEEPTNGEVLWVDTDDDTEDGGFVLTEAEKAEIAQMAADKVDVSGKAEKTEVPNAAKVENNELTMMRDENPLFSVPLPVGGGSGGAGGTGGYEWVKIADITLEEEVARVNFSTTEDGRTFEAEEIEFLVQGKPNSAAAVEGVIITINNKNTWLATAGSPTPIPSSGTAYTRIWYNAAIGKSGYTASTPTAAQGQVYVRNHDASPSYPSPITQFGLMSGNSEKPFGVGSVIRAWAKIKTGG